MLLLPLFWTQPLHRANAKMSLVWERKLKNVGPTIFFYVYLNPLKCFSLIPLLAFGLLALFVILYVIFVFYS